MSELTTKQMMDALGSLYHPDYGDLELRVQHTLTEPTCPTAIIEHEDDPKFRFRYDADTIEQAVAGAVAAAYWTLILRRGKPLTVPWTERDEDKNVADFLAAMDASRDP